MATHRFQVNNPNPNLPVTNPYETKFPLTWCKRQLGFIIPYVTLESVDMESEIYLMESIGECDIALIAYSNIGPKKPER